MFKLLVCLGFVSATIALPGGYYGIPAVSTIAVAPVVSTGVAHTSRVDYRAPVVAPVIANTHAVVVPAAVSHTSRTDVIRPGYRTVVVPGVATVSSYGYGLGGGARGGLGLGLSSAGLGAVGLGYGGLGGYSYGSYGGYGRYGY